MDSLGSLSSGYDSPISSAGYSAESAAAWQSALQDASGGAPQVAAARGGGGSGSGAVQADKSAIEMYGLASAVYDKTGAPPGWTRVDDNHLKSMGLDPNQFHPQNSDFRAALFQSADGRTVLSFKGTTPSSSEDWINNAKQGFGAQSDYYSRAIRLAQSVSNTTHGNFEITGHSLGGGLASAAGIVTGAKTTTFNAAGVTPATLAPYHKTLDDAKKTTADGRPLVDAYIVNGEILNNIQGSSNGVLGAISPIGNAILNLTGHHPQTAAGVQHILADPHPIPDSQRVNPWLDPIGAAKQGVGHAIYLHGPGSVITDALNNQLQRDEARP